MEKKDFDVEKAYNELKTKYSSLPSFESINSEFEISSIDEEDFLVRKIRRRMSERIIFYCKLIENIIFPNLQNPLSAYEAGFIEETQREKLTKMHKELMVLERESLLLDVDLTLDENKDLEFILNLLNNWSNFKKEIVELVFTMKESWKKEVKEENHGFFG